MNIRRKSLHGARGLAAAMLLTLCAAVSAPAAQTLRLGVLMPLSGDLASFTPPMQNGVILAAKFVHEAGGPRMEIVGRDSRADTAAAVEAARRLVDVDKVNAIIGPVTSEAVMEAALRVTAPAGVVLVSPSATATDIAALADDGYVFSSISSDAAQGSALAALTREKGYGKIAILKVGNLYGNSLSRSFRAALEGGGKITADVPFSRGEVSYRSELTRVLEGSPDAVLLIAYPEDGVRILTQAADIDRPLQWLFTHTMKDRSAVARVGGGYLEGASGTSPVPSDPERYQRFAAAYERMFDDKPSAPFVDTSFDAAILLALAAVRAGTTQGPGLRDSLRAVSGPPGEQLDYRQLARAFALLGEGKEIDYEGVSGPLDFDERGDARGAYGVWTIQGGIIRDVRPPAAK